LEFIVAVGILLTYLQKVRNELRVSEAKQKAMIANISDVIAVFDADCTIVYKSPNIERWFGWRPEDLIGTDGWKTVHPEDLDRVQNEFSELLEEADRARTVTYRYQCKDGSYKWIELTAVNLLKDTAICGILANYRDITTRRLAEEQIRQLQKAESLGRMAGAVAHHYNNLLFSVMGNLELAGDDVPKDSVVAENMQQALASAGKAAKLSRLLLSYLGQTPGRFEVLDISEHCRLALPALQPDLPDNLALEADLISSELMVSLDPEQTRQILDNLITNAREAMEGQTGRIVLRLTKVSREAILGSNRFPADWQPRQKHYACLEVTDTGVGIAAEDIGKVFDPFYTGKHTGRGLGLAVVLGNVKSHAGCITVASEPGLGSTFRVFWPLTEAKVVEAVAEVPPAAQTTKAGETILVVDDQESVRRVSKALLERLGFEVITAGDGAEAVEIFRENPDTIKLVLSDLSMPRMNGWETLAALRAIRGDIPVILASGYDEAKALSGGHAEQPQAFLQKPYQMQTLQETLHRALAAGNTSINLQS
ncbi:MAG: PAS domain S-box protein, partial [Desulfohalobiaceae bacterium]|nr:PAS domain S-box protein [Desulfohalobiaceae bacterium]